MIVDGFRSASPFDYLAPLLLSLPWRVPPQVSLPLLRCTPAEFSLEKVRSFSVVGPYDVSVLCFLFSRLILLFVCFSVPCTTLFCLPGLHCCLSLAHLPHAYVWFVEAVGNRSCTICIHTQRVPSESETPDVATLNPLLFPTTMTSESGRSQILTKWQEAFTRLNGNQPGITGLLGFTKVCSRFFHFLVIFGAICV